MDVTVHIPDDIAARLMAASGDLSRRALESLALEECKNGHISDPELLLLLGFQSRYELDGFLRAHGIYEDFNMDDFERDMADLQSAATGADLIAAMQACPVKNIDLEPERFAMPVRDVVF